MKYFLLIIGLIALINIYIKIALKHNIIDKPNKRSSHTQVTVRGGGIIVPITALCWFLLSGFQFPMFFFGLIIISTISFWDDLSQISHKLRLMVHFGAIILLFMEIELQQFPWWLWIPVLIISAGAINVYNFMDGINGITGGYSLVVLSSLWIVNNFQDKFVSNELLYFLIISIIVFSYFNFRTKAKCFAGDIGSISTAYIIVFLLARLIIQSGNWLYVLFLSLYGVDSVLTIVQRIIQKENIFAAHRKHLYQLLANELKVPHVKVAALYSISQFVICMIVIYMSRSSATQANKLFTGTCIIVILSIIINFSKVQILNSANRLKEANYFLDKSA